MALCRRMLRIICKPEGALIFSWRSTAESDYPSQSFKQVWPGQVSTSGLTVMERVSQAPVLHQDYVRADPFSISSSQLVAEISNGRQWD